MFLRPFLIACSVLFVSGAAWAAEEPKSESAAKPTSKISRTPLVLRQGGTPVRIYNQARDFSIGPMTEVIRERVDWRK